MSSEGIRLSSSNNYSHTIIHVLDDLEGGVDAGGFGDGFYEVIVPFLVVEYLNNIQVSISLLNGSGVAGKTRVHQRHLCCLRTPESRSLSPVSFSQLLCGHLLQLSSCAL
jgi:hypothetical protein